jgi:hypothetical protein
MFRTTRDAAIPRPAFLGEDVQLWSYIEHGLHVPWFYVRLVHLEDGLQMSHMLMLSKVETLQSVLTEKTSTAWVEDVQLVSPSYVNKSDRWLMEPLLELTEVGNGPGTAKSYIYRVLGDRLYTQGQTDSFVWSW